MVWDDNRAVNWRGGPSAYIYKLKKNTYTYTQAYALNQQNVANTYRRTHTQTLPTICKLYKLFWIQDSRFWEKLLESRPWLSSRAPCQSALGFKKFFPQSWILNLESQKCANFANFPGSINKRYVRGIVVCSRSIKWYLKGI